MRLADIENRLKKMSSLGNKFLIVDNLDGTLGNSAHKDVLDCINQEGPKEYRKFDQMLLITQSINGADFWVRVFNSDKTEAGQCGNGVRCVAQYARDEGLVDGNIVHIQTQDGKGGVTSHAGNTAANPSSYRVVVAKLLNDMNVRANIGPPIFDPDKVPFRTSVRADYYLIELDCLSSQLKEKFHCVLKKVGIVSMGNPHAVMQVDSIDEYSADEVDAIGTIFQRQELLFPEQINVGLMQVQTRSYIRLRVYERGVGETKACGSGACAAVAVGRQWGMLNNAVQVELPGGMLIVEQDAKGNLTLTGPVESSWED